MTKVFVAFEIEVQEEEDAEVVKAVFSHYLGLHELEAALILHSMVPGSAILRNPRAKILGNEPWCPYCGN